MSGGWTWLLIDVVGVAILGVFLFYGQRQSAKCRGVQTSARAKALAATGLVGAAALTVFLIVDASRRNYDLGLRVERLVIWQIHPCRPRKNGPPPSGPVSLREAADGSTVTA